jgi:hypothetical protein
VASGNPSKKEKKEKKQEWRDKSTCYPIHCVTCVVFLVLFRVLVMASDGSHLRFLCGLSLSLFMYIFISFLSPLPSELLVFSGVFSLTEFLSLFWYYRSSENHENVLSLNFGVLESLFMPVSLIFDAFILIGFTHFCLLQFL